MRHIFLRAKVGDLIQDYVDCATRVAFVIAAGATRDDATESAQRAVDLLKFVTEPA